MNSAEYASLLDRRARGEKLTRSEAAKLAHKNRAVEKRLASTRGFTRAERRAPSGLSRW